MRESLESIAGDTPGLVLTFPVFRAEGRGGARAAYLQGALHAQELPGTVALHFLLPMIAAAERDGRLAGDVTIVPHANPLGLAQALFHDNQGRFELNSRVNFNRAFPLPGDAPLDPAFASTAERLKARLLELSAGADLVFDCHCDDEGPVYLYVPAPCWPEAERLAAGLGARAVLLWEGEGGGAFEDAVYKRWLAASPDGRLPGKIVSTVEFRGILDVDERTARADAEGLYRTLVALGVVEDASLPALPAWTGPALPQDNVEMLRTPVSGPIFYAKAPGDAVEAGETVARVVASPGSPDGVVDLVAPQAGFVLTRRARRFARRGDDVAKIAATTRSPGARSGPLEP